MTDEALESVIEAGKTATEPPADGDDVNFEAPWQARAFGITVALRRREAFDWSRFRDRLVAELEDADAGDEATYYEAWLRAIEGLLVDDGVVEAGELAERTRAFDRGERDASEFVVGGDGHNHSHGHDHENGHDQEH